ncbi:UDP-glucose 4-epimerase [Saccharopolyspora lacisalsi]|uniref:UDP-glucose 4-epimerase n=1 Tax=Halosaccharopolyspora lacisalsi TaxID=1000566 RepID=A0A839E2S4_9PSEU|nr:NAD-dependent epimerase/dehydratase family protein [Halosaccharopolyspora lacisalsi]MBA8827169.1 UDP-glucose 4-epimerase [Halosaccharopolyspora lacisalsi]
MPNVVLVTGVGRFLGGYLASRLAVDPGIDRVLGVDTVAPPRDLLRRMGRAEFVRADIRNPLIAKIITSAKVDTVVHTSMSSQGATARADMKEMNVIGTMQLLAACQQSSWIRKIVVKSTSAVYGVSPRDPAIFTEDMEPKELPSSGYAKDAVEIEEYVRGFARRRPDVDITTLRFTDLVGPRIDDMITRYFGLPVIPTVLGYDARLQMLHSEDALTVLERSVVDDVPGVFNVGGDGILMLSQAIRRAGRVSVPVPGLAVSSLKSALGGMQNYALPSGWMQFLNFGRVVDTTKMRKRFDFEPRWTTRQAFDDFVNGRGLRPWLSHEQVTSVEHGVNDAVARIHRGRNNA